MAKYPELFHSRSPKTKAVHSRIPKIKQKKIKREKVGPDVRASTMICLRYQSTLRIRASTLLHSKQDSTLRVKIPAIIEPGSSFKDLSFSVQYKHTQAKALKG